MKKKILSIVMILFLAMMIIFLTGCGNNNNNSNEVDNENNESSVQETISLDRTQDFDGEIAVVTETKNYVGTHYVIDRNFKILSSYEGNSTYIDGYIQIRNDNEEKTNILDKNGNIVFSYGDHEYEEVELVDDGCIITTKQSDTYNSSSTVTGVYNLSEQKYIIEPSEEYVGKIRTFGDDMLLLNDEQTEFLNLKTKDIVTYSEKVTEEFNDRYSVLDDNDNYQVWYLKVFDDKGNVKRIRSPYEEEEIIYGNEHQNGMVFEVTSYVYRDEENNQRIRTLCSIFNLETGDSKDLSDEFWIVTNKPHYTEDGYALVNFTNQGGTPYYTVIDKEGNKLFEPQKVNNSNGFEPEDNGEARKMVSTDLYEGNYFIVTDNDVYEVIDKDNNVILTAEENESFEGVTNNAVKVHWKKQGYYEQYYYKDLDGNRISIG